MEVINMQTESRNVERNPTNIRLVDDSPGRVFSKNYKCTLLKTSFDSVREHTWMQITLAILGLCSLQRASDMIDRMSCELYYMITIHPMLAFSSSLICQCLSIAYYIVKVYPIPTAVICSLVYEYPHIFKKYIYNVSTYGYQQFYLKSTKE